jgi:hypothetical protein
MRKVIPFLSSVAIMAVLTLRQRMFLVQSDSGRQWAVMAPWFEFCRWFLSARKTHLMPALQRETTIAPPARPAALAGVRDGEAANPSRVGDPRLLVYSD